MRLERYRKSLKKLKRRLQNRLRGGRRILVLGDSHCAVFEYCFDHGLLAPHWLNAEIVGGATAGGLNNDRSASGAWQKFGHALRRYADFDVIVLMVGECDCSYALWKKSERDGVAPERLIEHSLAGVARLIGHIRAARPRGIHRIILVGAILPTVDDAHAPSQDNLLRREITASQAARTQLVLAYNRGLQGLAEARDVACLDITAAILDPRTGLIDRRFVERADDHHLSPAATAQFWSSSLMKLI